MVPFHLKANPNPDCDIDALGIIEFRKTRKSKACYASLNFGTGWDYQTHELSGEYADYYGPGLACIAHYICDNILDYDEVFRDAYLKNPEKFPSFRLKHGTHKTMNGEDFSMHCFDFDEQKLTLTELNGLLAVGNSRLRVW